MGQGILSNMWLCPDLSLPEPSAVLKLAGAEATEWKYLESKTYVRGRSRGIKTGDAENLEI